MPREARLILDEVCYHVITRGNEKRVTFKSDNDYEKYMQLLLKYKKKYKFKVYGWCLMNNYLINCISYIEYNPVRAKIVARPEDYKWSSYRARVLGEKSELLDAIVL